MKKIYITIVVISAFIFTLIPSKKIIYAQETSSMKNLFNNAFWGVCTGSLMAVAYTATKNDVNKDNWQKSVGIGATIGAVAGLSYGLASEKKYYGPFTPSAYIRLYPSKKSSSEICLFLNCFHYYF